MIYFGCDEVTKGWNRYFSMCNALEVTNGTTPETDPTIQTLNKWRTTSPKGFAFVMHARRSVTDALVLAYENDTKTLTDALKSGWEETENRARALAAKTIIVQTDVDFRPSDSTRALMAEFGEYVVEHSDRPVIWESAGLWTIEDAQQTARSAGLVPCYDPFIAHADDIKPERGNDVCFRITERAAARRQFDEYDLESILTWAEHFNRTFVLCSGRFKFLHAKQLSLLVSERE